MLNKRDGYLDLFFEIHHGLVYQVFTVKTGEIYRKLIFSTICKIFVHIYFSKTSFGILIPPSVLNVVGMQTFTMNWTKKGVRVRKDIQKRKLKKQILFSLNCRVFLITIYISSFYIHYENQLKNNKKKLLFKILHKLSRKVYIQNGSNCLFFLIMQNKCIGKYIVLHKLSLLFCNINEITQVFFCYFVELLKMKNELK